jgi:hypothetical protein
VTELSHRAPATACVTASGIGNDATVEARKLGAAKLETRMVA